MKNFVDYIVNEKNDIFDIQMVEKDRKDADKIFRDLIMKQIERYKKDLDIIKDKKKEGNLHPSYQKEFDVLTIRVDTLTKLLMKL